MLWIAFALTFQTASAQIFHINKVNCNLSAADIALLNRIARFEAGFYNDIFGTQKNDSVTVDINIYGKQKEYNVVQKDAMNTTFIDGFYSPRDDRIYLYKSDVYMKTLFHETSHKILGNNFRNPPQWLNEGIATLLGYLEETPGTNKIVYIPQRVYIRQVRDSIKANRKYLENYFRYKTTDWYDEVKRPMLYATAYCIVYFFINIDRDYLEPTLNLMKQGYSTPMAIQKIFGGFDKFNQRFYDFYTAGAGSVSSTN